MIGEIINKNTGGISRVRHLRIESGYSRGQISVSTGLSINALYSIEENKENYSPNFATVAKLAKFFNVPMNEVYDVDLSKVKLELRLVGYDE